MSLYITDLEKSLAAQLAENDQSKVFTNTIIQDLKQPTESLVESV